MFKDVAANFSAGASYDPDGYITRYVWNFGDGTVENTTDLVVSHAYNATKSFTVTLTVYDNGTPPLPSPQFYKVVMVGLILQYFNWLPLEYGVIALVCVGILLYAVTLVRRAVRRRAERKRRVLATVPSTTPVTKAQKD
jgi:hypothetical protein